MTAVTKSGQAIRLDNDGNAVVVTWSRDYLRMYTKQANEMRDAAIERPFVVAERPAVQQVVDLLDALQMTHTGVS